MIAGVLLMCVTAYSYAANNIKDESLTLAQKKGVMFTIPQQALVFRNGVAGVFIVQKNKARFRMVRLGKNTQSSIYILAGLLGNETILLSNVSKLFDGMPLNLSNE